ncbi:MAG: peptidase M56 [Sphingomonas sp.]|nr:peptidase M56 [Sphingomonas sp.]
MIPWIVETLIATSLLMAAVMLLRQPARRVLGPALAYGLWAIPVLRLVMPPLPGGWGLSRVIEPFMPQAAAVTAMPAQAAAPEAAQVIVISAGDAATTAAPQVVAATAQMPALSTILLAVWIGGALAFLAYHLVRYALFCARLQRLTRRRRRVAEGRVEVIETDGTQGPLAFGIWRKYVAFPSDFAERYDPVERSLALAHELAHHRRGDLIANWVALVLLAIHWWNPIAWRAFRAFRADQEMACDELVLAGRNQSLRHAYGRAIVKSAHGGAVSAACHLHTINELKGRLRMLSKTRKFSPKRIAGGIAGVSILSLAALGLTASGSQAAERITRKVEKTLGVAITQSAPAAPEAPAAPAAPAVEAAPPAPPAAPAVAGQEAPPAPPEAPAAPAPGTHVEKRVYRITTDGKDGKKVVVIADSQGTPDMSWVEASVPEVKEGACRGKSDDGKSVVQVTPGKDGKKQVIVICTKRIEAMAKASEDMAKDIARRSKDMGLRSAIMGLRAARNSIEANGEMPADAKAEALKGIDEAIAEVEKEAKSGDD